MAASKRESVRINFGSRDPVDPMLLETLRDVAQQNGCGHAAAAKRLITLGALLFNGYDPRAIANRLPKQKILWAEAIWPLLRRYSTGSLHGPSSESDADSASQSSGSPSQALRGVTPFPAGIQLVQGTAPMEVQCEDDATPHTRGVSAPSSPRLDPSKFKFP